MSFILHIDTATENAMICLSKDEKVIDFITNNKQKEHASFLHSAIKQLMERNKILLHQLSAISVTKGAGSYTGLRVSMSCAKGLCYALKIPLITISTLEAMALSVIENTFHPELFFYCPMIDARRMEVLTAMFDDKLNELQPPHAVILDPEFFKNMTQEKQIIFSGNGTKKITQVINYSSTLLLSDIYISPFALVKICIDKFNNKLYDILSNADPAYIKEFYTIKKIY